MPAALASLPIVGILPILGIAQASRQKPEPAQLLALDTTAGSQPQIIDRPATITLGMLIEIQRRAREQRAAMAGAEQLAADLPPGESWRAQLGAFSSADAAERQRARLIEAGVPVVVRQEGALHRLQSLPAIRAETEGLCVRAQAGGVDCFVRRVADET
ncbi:SPOR domain-containing protein [Sphingomonas gei]|uniref:SPOR domain-containing protein n=1 Tax=Sphingomonas gei TaxID=1395960 RepID=A0A4S1XK22_9SPHN|nr:SPOR domain-containing protein [Sphingomonas gei]TGX56213.1 SPOR domain-containing protein [Sphingomonas gei]